MRRPSLHHAVGGLTRRMSNAKKIANNESSSGIQTRSCHSDDSATIFCSKYNRTDNVKQGLAKLRGDGTARELHIEDLLLSGSDEKMLAVQDFLIQTTTKQMMVVPEECVLQQPAITDWRTISFVDCVGTRDLYVEYKVKRKRFVKTLEQYYCMVNHTSSLDLPLTFKVKLDLHAPMDIFSIIQLLQEIVHDPAVQEVEFPNSLKASLFTDAQEAAKTFASMVNKRTLRWSGPMVTLYVSYKGDSLEESSNSSIDGRGHLAEENCENIPYLPPCRRLVRKRDELLVRGPSRYNSATVALLKECAVNLEKLTLMNSRASGCCNRDGSSLSVLSSTSSRRASIYGECGL